MSKSTKTEAEKHGQQSIEDAEVKEIETKDSLTKGDIEEIEKRLFAKFNSEFAVFAKRVMEDPPTSVHKIENIRSEFSKMYGFADNIARTVKSLNELKMD